MFVKKFAGRTPGARERDGPGIRCTPTGVRRGFRERLKVGVRAAERVCQGRHTLGLRAELDAKRCKLVGVRGFEPPAPSSRS